MMVCHTPQGVQYAPLYRHRFSVVQAHCQVEAYKLLKQYPDPTLIPTIGEKLRWYRHEKGLLQREVANMAGLDRKNYIRYENNEKDKYPMDKLQALAKILEIPIEHLLDDYNRFLQEGQAAHLKAIRKANHMSQEEFAVALQVPKGTLKKWEQGRAVMAKASWSKLAKLGS